jgi:chromosomal replication initiator protein
LPHPDAEHAWELIRSAAREAAGERTFDLWVAPLSCDGIDADTLLLSGPREVVAWSTDRLRPLLEAATRSVIGPAATLQITVAGERLPAARSARTTTPDPEPAPAPPTLNPRYTFEEFVIGESNHLAHAAALSVAELPAQAYNPLFIYGPPGLGKTHLLHSIGNYIRLFGGGLTVHYTTVETFTNEFISALSGGSLTSFKHRLRTADVLLVDDVQFLERKARTEEELFHTINALYDAGSQLVLTSDRLPSDLDALEERLRERFEAGLVTDIGRPDFATRLTILRRRAAHDGAVSIEDEALEVVAASVDASVRALEGALTRVTAYASLTGQPVTGEVAEEVMQRLAPRRRARSTPTIEAIQAAACEQFGVSQEELLSRSRVARVAWPRQAAMYVARELTGHSLPVIAQRFGGRDHTTVLHACRRVADRLATDPDGYNAIEKLTATVTTAHPDRR